MPVTSNSVSESLSKSPDSWALLESVQPLLGPEYVDMRKNNQTQRTLNICSFQRACLHHDKRINKD